MSQATAKRPAGEAILAAESGIRALLTAIGEDPMRPGVLDTPSRVVRAFQELTAGYTLDPADVLKVQFEQEETPYGGIVLVKRIPFTSLCEHHCLPVTGYADVAYAVGEKVVGLSKLARLVDVFARRLQVQERMTQQIHDSLVEHLQPSGAAVVVRASHACMGLRGACKPGAEMVTSCFSGTLRDPGPDREELLLQLR